MQLTDFSSSSPETSPDMRSIACFGLGAEASINENPTLIYVIPFEGGKPLNIYKVPGILSYSAGICWTPDSRGLTYAATRGGVSNIWEQPLDGSAPQQLTDFKSDLISSFAWSKDRRLVCTRAAAANDVILISNFR